MQKVLLFITLLTVFNAAPALAAPSLGDIDIPFRTITVDGSADDWSGISPVATDNQGDTTGPAGTDLKAVYVAMDSNFLYFRMDIWDPPFYIGKDPTNTDAGRPSFKVLQSSKIHIYGDIESGVWTEFTNIWRWVGSNQSVGESRINDHEHQLLYTGIEYGSVGNVTETKIPLDSFGNYQYVLFDFYIYGGNDDRYDGITISLLRQDGLAGNYRGCMLASGGYL